MVVVPIWNAKQEWIGSLGVAIPLKIISEKLSSIKLSKDSFAWLTDANDLIVSHPNNRFVLNVTLTTDEAPNFPDFNKIVQQTRTQNSGYGRYLDLAIDTPKIVTFSKINSLPGWTLFITTKESEIFREINIFMRNIVIVSIVLTVIFLFIISQLSNQITKPIFQLIGDVHASVKDKGNHLKLINSNDEIGQLSKAFYDSAQKIHQHTIHLEKMVNLRTQELSHKNTLLNEQNDKLAEIASKDPLTQLYNRRAFNNLLEKEISRSKRHKHNMSLVVIDIDDFKKINDSYGHHIGDDVLSRFANALSSDTRKENIICRWGGEEFVILIPEATSDMVFQHIDAIRKKIATMDFLPVNQVPLVQVWQLCYLMKILIHGYKEQTRLYIKQK
jgi:diguanylate cyclase (GGDEF)-like protein